MISDPGEIFNPTPANQDYRVFLQVMSLSGDIGADLKSIGKPDSGYLT
jgi:hypothetical protein